MNMPFLLSSLVVAGATAIAAFSTPAARSTDDCLPGAGEKGCGPATECCIVACTKDGDECCVVARVCCEGPNGECVVCDVCCKAECDAECTDASAACDSAVEKAAACARECTSERLPTTDS